MATCLQLENNAKGVLCDILSYAASLQVSLARSLLFWPTLLPITQLQRTVNASNKYCRTVSPCDQVSTQQHSQWQLAYFTVHSERQPDSRLSFCLTCRADNYTETNYHSWIDPNAREHMNPIKSSIAQEWQASVRNIQWVDDRTKFVAVMGQQQPNV